MAAQPASIATLLLFLPLLVQCQFDVCRNLRDSKGGPGWEFYACQPSPSNMKEVMQIRVDPPGITCGNPPERFCTLVSATQLIEHKPAESLLLDQFTYVYVHCKKKKVTEISYINSLHQGYLSNTFMINTFF